MDLNFRKKLWSEKKAQSVMRPLMEYVDVVIANEEDIQSVLGFEVHGTDVTTGALNLAATRRRLREKSRAPSTARSSPSRCARAIRPATTAGAR